jgi:hypothetical protein
VDCGNACVGLPTNEARELVLRLFAHPCQAEGMRRKVGRPTCHELTQRRRLVRYGVARLLAGPALAN